MPNKYSYIFKIGYDVLWRNRGRVMQVYPETTSFFLTDISKGCRGCKKKRISRDILLRIVEMDPTNRDKTPLKGVFPQELLDLL